MYANLPGAKVPLNIFSSWGGLSCHLKLTAVPGSLIRLTITSFLIEPTDCVNDALTVYDALLPMRGRILHRWVCSCLWTTVFCVCAEQRLWRLREINWTEVNYFYLFIFLLCRLCEAVSMSLSLVSTSNVMLLSFRMTSGNKIFRGHFEAIAEEGTAHLPVY